MTAKQVAGTAVLGPYRQAIDTRLAQYFAALPTLLPATSAGNNGVLTLIKDITLRPSKRLRGALAAMVYDDLTERTLSPAGLALGATMELLQSYLLILDDVADRADSRRGGPTLQRIYRARGVGEHTSSMLAVTAGAITQHLANLLLVRCDVPAARILRALDYLQRAMVMTGFGQAAELLAANANADRAVTQTDILETYELKTGYYTFVAPVQSALALAGVVDEAMYTAAAQFGAAAGMAFQLHDDHVDIFGNPEASGKPAMGDITEAKRTVLVHYALTHAADADRTALQNLLGKTPLSSGDQAAVKDILRRSGAVQAGDELTEAYVRKADASIAALSVLSPACREVLRRLLQYSVQRES